MTGLSKIAVLISGRGSNLESLIKNAKFYQIAAVISNKADAGGLDIARQHGIPALPFDRRDYGSVREQKEAIFGYIEKTGFDLIALAGFMLILPAEFTDKFSGKIVNIHPSLLPRFPGLDTHRRALEAGETEHGCSVHYVDGGVDTGPLIARASCSIVPGEDHVQLAARVLSLEHKLYPWAVNMIAQGETGFKNGQVFHSPGAVQSARENNFLLP